MYEISNEQSQQGVHGLNLAKAIACGAPILSIF
jgi:hypothetical protein